SASGRKASRVRMGLLLQSTRLLPCGGDSLMDACWHGSAGNIVDGKHVAEPHKIIEIVIELRSDASQLLEREALQLTLVVEGEADCFTDVLVRDAERHTFLHEIGGGGEGVHVSSFGGLLHALKVELH